MDELAVVMILKNVSLVAAVLGILVGLDLLLGAKFMLKSKKKLDKTFNFDSIAIKWFNALRNRVDKYFDFDAIVIKTKARMILSVLYILMAVIIFLLVRKVK